MCTYFAKVLNHFTYTLHHFFRLKDHQIIFNTNTNNKYKGVGDNMNEEEGPAFVNPTINISEYAPFSSILTIHNLTINHNGNYTCQIKNPAGTVEYSAVLSVSGWYTPTVHL